MNTPFQNIEPQKHSSNKTRTMRYRFGFNGKEMDNEVSGTGNQYDYGFRIYNPRLGRFLSVDPLCKSFPWNSSYSFAENDVIRSIDLDGKEREISNYDINIHDISSDLLREDVKSEYIKYHIEKNVAAANSDLNLAWNNSFKSDGTVRENGVIVAERKSSFYPLSLLNGTLMSLDQMEGDEKGFKPNYYLNPSFFNTDPKGSGHTHVYEQNLVKKLSDWDGRGMPPSVDDNFAIYPSQGFVGIVESGSKRFAIVIVDVEKYDAFKNKRGIISALRQIEDSYTKKLNPNDNPSSKVLEGLKIINMLIGDNSGLKLYESTNESKTEFQEVK